MTDGLGRIVERATGRAVAITWVDPPGEDTPAPHRQPAGNAATEAGRPTIGLVGAPPLVFDPFMNDHLVSFIESHGAAVALPDPQLLVQEDTRFTAQLQRFADAGVDHVIYLVSFGCLKGHVHARGAARGMARRFRDMPITIVDYDPEASALNRENRIRLALTAAFEHAGSRA